MTIRPIHPVIMGKINGIRYCGKRADYNFTTAIRSDLDGRCPYGYKVCGVESETHQFDVDNLICISERRSSSYNCPITRVSFGGGKLTFSKIPMNLPLTNFRLDE